MIFPLQCCRTPYWYACTFVRCNNRPKDLSIYVSVYLLARDAQQTLEDASKLVVEDGVDDGVEEAVDVAEPDEEGEEKRVEAADDGHVEQIVTDARGVDDVEREERNPAEQKHACNRPTGGALSYYKRFNEALQRFIEALQSFAAACKWAWQDYKMASENRCVLFILLQNWLDYINLAYLAVLLTKECIIELILLSFREKLNLFTKLVYKQIGEALQSVL